MGFMNVFLFFIITAEVHTHNKVPANRIPKAPQARKLLRENNKKERLRFLFLVSVSGFCFCSWFLFLCLFSRFLPFPLVSTSVQVSFSVLDSGLGLCFGFLFLFLFPVTTSRLCYDSRLRFDLPAGCASFLYFPPVWKKSGLLIRRPSL